MIQKLRMTRMGLRWAKWWSRIVSFLWKQGSEHHSDDVPKQLNIHSDFFPGPYQSWYPIELPPLIFSWYILTLYIYRDKWDMPIEPSQVLAFWTVHRWQDWVLCISSHRPSTSPDPGISFRHCAEQLSAISIIKTHSSSRNLPPSNKFGHRQTYCHVELHFLSLSLEATVHLTYFSLASTLRRQLWQFNLSFPVDLNTRSAPTSFMTRLR